MYCIQTPHGHTAARSSHHLTADTKACRLLVLNNPSPLLHTTAMPAFESAYNIELLCPFWGVLLRAHLALAPNHCAATLCMQYTSRSAPHPRCAGPLRDYLSWLQYCTPAYVRGRRPSSCWLPTCMQFSSPRAHMVLCSAMHTLSEHSLPGHHSSCYEVACIVHSNC